EEERRLFYVGITRARQKLYITRSASRVRMGSIQSSPASRFLRELPPEVLEQNSYFRHSRAYIPQRQDSSLADVEGQVLEYDQDVAPDFRSGDRVVHPHFGYGKITQIQGSGNAARVKVRFEGLGEKLLLVQYAKLKKIL
ncbi:MAG: 3'-5' exonuclease, partial [Planctomycetota bacterium]